MNEKLAELLRKLYGLANYDNLRTAGEVASMTPTPLGDVASGMLAVDDLRKGDYLGAAGNAVGLLPFVPGVAGITRMNPDDFLRLAAPFGKDGGRKLSRETIDYHKKTGDVSGSYLTVKESPEGLRVGLHDGRHRAIAARELNIPFDVDIKKGKRMSRDYPDMTEDDLLMLIKKQGGLLPEY